MPAQSFLSRVNGRTKRLFGIQQSAGTGSAGALIAAGNDGKLDSTFLPAGIGGNTQTATASEALSAGAFVNLYSNGGTWSARNADNSNGREADGFVIAATASGGVATIYPLDATNSGVSGLTTGTDYWLGTGGQVISTPLDATLTTNAGYIDQYLGRASSPTSLVTNDDGWVVL